jgi:DeoR/GlpR family transcriptional regulator of sugar metabolism
MERPRNLKKHRQLIFRRVVLDNRPMTLKEMRELLRGERYTDEMARCDVDALRAVGCLVKLERCPDHPKEKQIVFLDGPHTDDDSIRAGINQQGKSLVARLTASLICGVAQCKEKKLLLDWMKRPDAKKAVDDLCDTAGPDADLALRLRVVLGHLQAKARNQTGPWSLAPVDELVELLRRSQATLEAGQKALRTKLRAYWEEPFRMVALDAGTTNLHIAERLSELHLPIPGSSLCSLTVCTNSRRIFVALGPPNVSVKCIMVGGQQKFHSGAIAGAMAELFLRTASILQFGMCVLGATKVDVERFVVCSDSQEEAEMKNLFMEKSSLRVITVDNGKLQTGPGREGYKFASIDPSHIDLIITNSPFLADREPEDGPLSFKDRVAAIEARGVPVLVATGPGTMDDPHR